MDAVLTEKIEPGDWILLAGPNFDIYGKVTGRNKQNGQLRIMTSTVYHRAPRNDKPSNEIRFVKIGKDDVPKRSRLYILSRIEHPPEGADTDPDPGRPVRP